MPSLLTEIEDARADLMTVDGQLHCLQMALDHGSEPSACSIVACHTRKLVTELLERLDRLASAKGADDEVVRGSQARSRRGAHSLGD